MAQPSSCPANARWSARWGYRGAGLRARVPSRAMPTRRIVLMGYLNPVEIYGWNASRAMRARLASTASCWSTVPPRKRQPGACGARVARPAPDPPGGANHQRCRACGWLVARHGAGLPLLRVVCRDHGRRDWTWTAVRERVLQIKRGGDTPVAVGFGVRDAESARAIAAFAPMGWWSAAPWSRTWPDAADATQAASRARPSSLRSGRRCTGGSSVRTTRPDVAQKPHDSEITRREDGIVSWLSKLMPSRIRTEGGNKRKVPEGLWEKCEGCGAVLYGAGAGTQPRWSAPSARTTCRFRRGSA
jgi:hypothetical protein